jgi:predicted 3-demethylubiquinone-9 3-methyltransferase (glyoxalase superfamily)
MSKITPFLWFEDQAEEAVNFYTSIFKNSKIGDVARYSDSGACVSGRKAGSVMTVAFELDGQKFIALNGGPEFKFNEAVSFVINCETQQEVDHMWSKLTEGGHEVQCGWLRDKYGISWQVVPTVISEIMSGEEPEKSERAMQALLQMKKIDIEKLKAAYNAETVAV